MIKRILAVIIVCILVFPSMLVFAANNNRNDIIILSKDISSKSENLIIDSNNNAQFKNGADFAVYTINVPAEREYNIELTYNNLPYKNMDIEFAMYINNELQNSASSHIILPRLYKEDGKITQDEFGNEIRAKKSEVYTTQSAVLSDIKSTGETLKFKFKAGINVVKIQAVKAGFSLFQITLFNQQPLISYSHYLNQFTKSSPENEYSQKIQGENSLYTSNTSIFPTYDRMSPYTELSNGQKNDPSKLRLNTIGQGNWKMPGQFIAWEFFVPNDGFYSIGLRAKQNMVRDFFSSRNIYIDGKIPFEDIKNYKFHYTNDWITTDLEENNVPFKFYLTKGKHIIKLEATEGAVGNSIQEFEEIIFDLNNLYRQIVMITGVNPDAYRDYNLYAEISDFNKQIQTLINRLGVAKSRMKKLGVTKGNNAVSAEILEVQLKSFIDKPRSVPTRIGVFQSNISALSGWVMSLKEQPLEIDYLYVKSANIQMKKQNETVLDFIIFRFRSFIASFFEDYSKLSNKDNKNIDVWIGLGRDQAQTIKDLTQNFFTPKEKIGVNISLVQNGLLEAIASGNAPDIMLYSSVSDPVNLAARNALTDLSGFDEFNEVKKRFHESALIPYTYKGKVYALPLEQSFYMMFYRKDIFLQLGITPPKTWEDFYKIISKIQKFNLTVGIPVGKVTIPDNTIFDTLLFQNNISYFNNDHSATNFNNNVAQNVFKQWTDFYSKYSLPIEFDFYNRFRSGEMPLALQPYTLYNLLSVAAPEINGLWEMAPIPGTLYKDGTFNNAGACYATSAIILKGTKNKEAAFKFLSWFTSAEIQTEYGYAIENIFGQGGRYDPANVQAFTNMNWSDNELSKLKVQFDNSKFTPIVPSTYIITRNITNAFRAVVIKGQNPRETLFSYNIDINDEIKRKNSELNDDAN